jgi:addiction module RelB/DinJ family antitoxin
MSVKTKSSNVNVHLYPEVKQEAENIFASQGLTLPEAITVFINHACHAGGFPFELHDARWQDSESLAALEESIQIEKNPDNYKHFSNAAELIADCLEGDDELEAIRRLDIAISEDDTIDLGSVNWN